MGVDRPVNAQIPDVLMRVADMGRTMYVVRTMNAQIPEVLMRVADMGRTMHVVRPVSAQIRIILTAVADNGANDVSRSPRQRTNQSNLDGSCGQRGERCISFAPSAHKSGKS